MTETEMLKKINEGHTFVHLAYHYDDFTGLVQQNLSGTRLIKVESEKVAEENYQIMIEGGCLTATNKEQVLMMERFAKVNSLPPKEINYRKWTKREVRLLKLFYPNNSMVVLRSFINRTESAISAKVEELGLKKEVKLKGRLAG